MTICGAYLGDLKYIVLQARLSLGRRESLAHETIDSIAIVPMAILSMVRLQVRISIFWGPHFIMTTLNSKRCNVHTPVTYQPYKPHSPLTQFKHRFEECGGPLHIAPTRSASQ